MNETTARERALRVLDRIEGTLVKDLRTMRAHAASHDDENPPDSPLGALNFGLALTALVACEGLGFFACGASQHLGKMDPRGVDCGTYITEFICRYFPKKSRFKRVAKILADRVRHELVHGFGACPVDAPFEVQVFVSADTSKDVSWSKLPPHIAVNSVALADQVISAVGQLRCEVLEDDDAANRVAAADSWSWKVGVGVTEQFDSLFHAERRDEAGA